MKEKTRANVYKAFVGEAKAYFRLAAFAQRADEEEFPQIAHLFRAIAQAEHVHATSHLKLLEDLIVSDSDTNLRESFNREKTVTDNIYPELIKVAEAEGERRALITFSHARDAEEVHLKLYERALVNTMSEKDTEYYVCEVCGYVVEKSLPDKCPICGVKQDKFRQID
ncbi:MAG: rubrerythrin family protein [Candidatus Cloacimonadota bacterium]|nr:MAG: rubrerythrin family protein [Candidatus Cloacimonadota bacterium]